MAQTRRTSSSGNPPANSSPGLDAQRDTHTDESVLGNTAQWLTSQQNSVALEAGADPAPIPTGETGSTVPAVHLVPKQPPREVEPPTSPRWAERVATAYRLPSVAEVAETVARCSKSDIGGASAYVVVLTGPVNARKVLVVEQMESPFTGTFVLPGGNVEAGESPEEAAVRHLTAMTGITAPSITYLGLYTGSQRDPRLRDATAFIVTLDAEVPPSSEAKPTAKPQWITMDSVSQATAVLGFDHAQMITDALTLIDNGSPYLGRMGLIVEAAQGRNADLLAEVDRMRGRGLVEDQEIYLREYDATQREARSRIVRGHGFVYTNVIVVMALAALAVVNTTARPTALLLIPWVGVCLGWMYLSNIDRVTALSDYGKYSMSRMLGSRRPGSSAPRLTPKGWEGLRTIVGCIIGVALFAAPAVLAPVEYILLESPDILWLIVAIAEIVLGGALGVLFIVQAGIAHARKKRVRLLDQRVDGTDRASI